MLKRRSFLLSLGAAAQGPALLGSSAGTTNDSLDRALVLSDGGARGANEAGKDLTTRWASTKLTGSVGWTWAGDSLHTIGKRSSSKR